MIDQLAQGLCNDEKMRSNLESGSTYAYNYQGNDGSIIGEIELTIEECENMDGLKRAIEKPGEICQKWT